MSNFSHLYGVNLTKLLTDKSEEIDENDQDFECILKCFHDVSIDHVDNNQSKNYPNYEQNLKNQQSIKSKHEAQKSNEKLHHSQRHDALHQPYPDYSRVPFEAHQERNSSTKKASSQNKFPIQLFKILERSEISGYSSIISWLPHGRAFMIHDEDLFKEHIMKKYFFQSKIESFKRQLYTYGFRKIGTRFADSGAYCQELFIRGRFDLCAKMQRWKKGKHSFASNIPPNFYTISEVLPNASNITRGDENAVERFIEPKTVHYMVHNLNE